MYPNSKLEPDVTTQKTFLQLTHAHFFTSACGLKKRTCVVLNFSFTTLWLDISEEVSLLFSENTFV